MVLRRQGGGLGIGVFLLASEVFRTGLGNIPPVTLGFLAFNCAIYMKILRLVRHVTDACVSFRLVWQLKQYRRLFLASFVHLDDMHLYFNMVSFLWKGRTLERKFGSRKFFIIIMVFAIVSQITMLFINRALSLMLWNSSYITTCAAGFSAVIFGLKVLTTDNMWQESVTVVGLPITVPAQFACWVELVLIQILVPNASFTGHLAGILTGFAYLHGPLSLLVDGIDHIVGNFIGQEPRRQSFGNRNTSFSSQAAPSGYRNRQAGNQQNMDDREAWELREAIRRSLEERSFTGSVPSSQGSQSQNGPYPEYGWNIPGVYTQQHDAHFASQPGDTINSQPTTQPPYSSDDQPGNLYPNLERYQQMPQQRRSMPSAPPMEDQGLFNVD